MEFITDDGRLDAQFAQLPNRISGARYSKGALGVMRRVILDKKIVRLLHGFIVGQPFRLRPLRQAIKHCVEHKHAKDIWFTRAGEIYDYCAKMKPGIIPGSVEAAKRTPKTTSKSKGKK